MNIVGELNDEKMAEKILQEFEKHDITGEYFYHDEIGSFVIGIHDPEKYIKAQDIYRVQMGIAKPMEIDPEWIKIKSVPPGSLNRNLIIFTVLIYILSLFEWGKGLVHFLYISESKVGPLFLEVAQGQIWRTISPIFLHMGILHILFNMLWLKSLGDMFEHVFGKVFYLLFILVVALFSNILQYYFKGPMFGGMSGVIYGFLGFIWVYKKLNKDFEYPLPKSDVVIMFLWFFVGLFGIFSNMANYAHVGGLFMGITLAICIDFKLELKRIKYFSMATALLVICYLIENIF